VDGCGMWLRVRVGMVLELSPNLCLDVETAVNLSPSELSMVV